MDNLTNTMAPLVIDIAIAAIILLVACLRAKAGIYHCVMSVVVIIVALAIGIVGSKLLTPIVKDAVWNGFYKQEIEEKFDLQVQKALQGTTTFTESFKDSWNNFIDSFDIFKSEKLESLDSFKIEKDDIDYSDSQLVLKFRALTLVKAELTLEKLIHLGLFGVISAVFLLLLTMLKNLLEKVANFSAVGWVNHGLGFVLGLVEIIVILIVIVRGAELLGINFFRNISEGTVLLSWLIGGDIQGTINSLQTLTIDDLKNIEIEDLTTVDLNDAADQLKELIKGVDLEKAPEDVKELIDKIDINTITEDVQEIVDSIDVEGLSDKATDIVQNVKDNATQKATDAILDYIK